MLGEDSFERPEYFDLGNWTSTTKMSFQENRAGPGLCQDRITLCYGGIGQEFKAFASSWVHLCGRWVTSNSILLDVTFPISSLGDQGHPKEGHLSELFRPLLVSSQRKRCSLLLDPVSLLPR